MYQLFDAVADRVCGTSRACAHAFSAERHPRKQAFLMDVFGPALTHLFTDVCALQTGLAHD
eukprot:5121103-Alexandrium_andersonii.AAC.1